MIDDLHSPDTFDTRLGERASANVTPCGVINKQTQTFLKHYITNVSIFCFILLLQSERSERAAT